VRGGGIKPGEIVSSPYHTPDPYGQRNPYANGQQYPTPGSPRPQAGFGTPPPDFGVPPPGWTQQPGHVLPSAPGVPQPGEQNQLALASVVLGFISIVGSLFCYGGILGPVSIGLGIAGVNRARSTGVGRSQSFGGIALGALGTAIGTAFIILFVVYRKKTMVP
jgi:hypothetical protein